MDKLASFKFSQKEHHRNKRFEEEFLEFCNDYQIEMGKKRTFDFFENGCLLGG